MQTSDRETSKSGGGEFSDDTDTPEILYKYISWSNEYHKKILILNEVYFASPREFNDPFEFGFLIDWDSGEEREWIDALAKRTKMALPDLPDSECRSEAVKRIREIRNNPQKQQEDADFRRRLWDESLGVFCLAASNNTSFEEHLLWAHYADGHMGLCLGFDSNVLKECTKNVCRAHEIGAGYFKVLYAKDKPCFGAKDVLLPGEMWKKVVRTKAREWEYENEYRLIIGHSRGLHEADRLATYPEEALKEVILGCRMEAEDEAEIKGLLAKRMHRVRLLKAHLDDRRYALNLDEVEY